MILKFEVMGFIFNYDEEAKIGQWEQNHGRKNNGKFPCEFRDGTLFAAEEIGEPLKDILIVTRQSSPDNLAYQNLIRQYANLQADRVILEE